MILAEQVVQRFGHQFLAAFFLLDLEQRLLLVDLGAESAGNVARINRLGAIYVVRASFSACAIALFEAASHSVLFFVGNDGFRLWRCR